MYVLGEKKRDFADAKNVFLPIYMVARVHKSSLAYNFLCLETDSYLLDAVTSSGILKAKQKLGRTFNFDKLGGIAFTKISKLTMCSA